MASGLMWAAAGVAVRFIFLSRDIDPLTLVQMRVTLTALLLGGTLAFRPSLLRIGLRDLPFLGAYGLFGLAMCTSLYYVAIREANVAVAVFLQFLAPIYSALYDTVVEKRRPSLTTCLVLLVALGGLALLVLGRDAGLVLSPLGIAAGLGSGVAFAFYAVAGRRGVARYGPWTLLFWGMAIAALAGTVIQPPWSLLARPWEVSDWAFFLYLALFSSAIPFALFLTGLKYVRSTPAMITGALEPVWATLMAAALLGESLTVPQYAGCALILSAVVALQVASGTAPRRKPAGEPPGATQAGPS
ncbi:MAG: hypothetical protein C4551_08105 [Bacillota bacterium]|nr:MAG: hypothetical protein C4551_08105 [Bacillota bacterium]